MTDNEETKTNDNSNVHSDSNANSNEQMMSSVINRRRGHRARASVLITKLNSLITDSPIDIEAIEDCISSLEKQRDKLISLNHEILEYLTEEAIIDDIAESEDRDDVLYNKIHRAKLFLESLKTQSQSSIKEGNLQTEVTEPIEEELQDNKAIIVKPNLNVEQASSGELKISKLQTKVKTQRVIAEKHLLEIKEHLAKTEIPLHRVEALKTVIASIRTSISNAMEEILPLISNDDEYLRTFEENSSFQVNIEEQLKAADTYLDQDKAESLTSSRHTHSGSNFRLERVTIPKFSGNITDYLTWKTAFYAAVEDQELSVAEKNLHLRNSLKNNALKMVIGLPQTDDYYKETLDILELHYNDPVKIVQNHLDLLSTLKAPEYKYQSLVDFSADFESNLRALQSHGIANSVKVPGDTAGNVIAHSISKLLPKQVREEVKEQMRKKPWTIELIRTALREAIVYLRVDSKEENFHSPEIKKQTANELKPKDKWNTKVKNEYYKPSQSTMTAIAQEESKSNYKCRFCNDTTHYEDKCPKFPSLQDRRKRLRELNRCTNCLKQGHHYQHCEGTYKQCYFCRAFIHQSAMCPQNTFFQSQGAIAKTKPSEKREGNVGANIGTNINLGFTTSFSLVTRDSGMPSVALPLAMLKVKGNNQVYHIKALFDTGSQRTLINKSVVEKLNLRPLKNIDLQINGINSEGTIHSYDIVSLNVLTREKPLQIEAIVLNQLPNNLNVPNLSSVTNSLKNMGIKLANPNQHSDYINDIDLIIGADSYPLFDPVPCKHQSINLLNSNVGTLIWGTLPNENIIQNSIPKASIFRVEINDPIDLYGERSSTSELDLQRLWSLSHIGINPKDLTVVEKTVLNDFSTDLTFEDGHYIVKLPWRTSNPELPDNYCAAKRIMYSTINKLSKDSEKLKLYDDIIKEQEALGYIEEIRPGETLHSEARVHYLPHHGVFKDSATSPLRIVFNSSSGKPSLNDNLWTGPCLLQNLCGLLIKFRNKKWATVSDIAKAFHNVGLYPGDRDSTRFLWVQDPSNPYSKLKTFRFKVVVFGVSSSPFLLNACLQHHLSKSDSPLSATISNNLYVDNLLGNFDTKEEVTNYYQTANSIMKEAGFLLREWNSNEPNLKSIIAQDNKGTETNTEKVLGMRWNTEEDSMIYNVKTLDVNTNTKRSILGVVSSIFDVLGYLNPVLIKGKMFLQKLWKADLKWDESLSLYHPELSAEWKSICKSLQRATELKVPRRLIFDDHVELHAFSDASGSAYGTAIYVVSAGESRLLISKARVAPIKEISIPKLELTAALLSARLTTFLLTTLKEIVQIDGIYCWVDSQVTLRWVSSKKQLPAYMQNRVEEIRQLLPDVTWKYVPSEDNPSDFISRGVSILKLKSDLWLKGPSWLSDPAHWPVWIEQDIESAANVHLVSSVLIEERATEPENALLTVTNYSSLRKLYRVTQLIFRFIENLRRSKGHRLISTFKKGKFSHNFTVEEIQKSESYWLYQVQRESFPTEVFVEGKGFPSSSKYHQFNVSFHTQTNLLRCDRRLGNSSLPFETAYPILLPHEHPFVSLLIQTIHKEHSHVNVPHLISLIRTKYFFMRMRQMLRNMVRKCILCKRLQGVHYPSSPNSMLPTGRVNECTPFNVVGVDYTGYFKVKEQQNVIKVYVALFSCAVTRAVHLELVEDNSVEVFLQALRRFVARRGLPSQIYSDNGSYFVAAANHIRKLHKLPSVKEYLNQHKISWYFNPSRASHVGGHFERLIGIVKSCLRKTLTTTLVTRNEFETVLVETEGLVNSRPLTYVSDQFVDDTPLTPQELLTGYQLQRLPIPNEYLEKDEDYGLPAIKTRYKKVLKIIENFWVRWKTEYLLHLKQQNTKAGQLQIQKGDVVLIENDGPRLKWRLGLVTNLHTAPDGYTRSVTLKTGTGIITRATIHLYPLEIKCHLETNASIPEEHPNQLKPKRDAFKIARERIANLYL